MDIEDIRAIPVTELLARLGHEPKRQRGDECWYLAPYREERTASFQVNVRKNVWHDFGTGKGGDIFTLAGELAGSTDFMEQAKFITRAWGGWLRKGRRSSVRKRTARKIPEKRNV